MLAGSGSSGEKGPETKGVVGIAKKALEAGSSSATSDGGRTKKMPARDKKRCEAETIIKKMDIKTLHKLFPDFAKDYLGEILAI